MKPGLRTHNRIISLDFFPFGHWLQREDMCGRKVEEIWEIIPGPVGPT